MIEVLGGDRLLVKAEASGEPTAEDEPIYLRLWGVSAPQGDQPYSDEAIAFVRQRLAAVGGEIEVVPQLLTIDETHIIATVYVGGDSLNLALIEAGFGWWQRDIAPEANDFELAELRARLGHHGLWQDPDPVDPSRLDA